MTTKLPHAIRKTTTGFIWWCPGCKVTHSINVGGTTGPQWTWNNDADRPTFRPSVDAKGIRQDMSADEEAAYDRDCKTLSHDQLLAHPVYGIHCHTFITDGQIQFLGDCTHNLANQTVDLPEWPYTPEEFHISGT